VAADLTGKGWEKQVDHWLSELATSTPRFHWHPHEPKQNGNIKLASGYPDREIIWEGRAYLIEVKEESGTSLTVGRSVGKDKEAGSGVKPSQYRELDLHLAAGAPCFVAVLLQVPAARERKQAQLLGPPARKAESIQRLIPWADYRPWIDRREAAIAAETRWMADTAQRALRGQPTQPRPEVQASIPAAELAVMGHPLRSAHELLAALRVKCEG
jgi:hypothetical protein